MIKNEPDNSNNDEPAGLAAIKSFINAIEKNASVYQEECFDERIEAIDHIEFPVIDHLDALIQKTDQPCELIALKHRAEKLKTELETINNNLFQNLRESIRSGEYAGDKFKNLIKQYIDLNLTDNENAGYNNLDIFINGLFPPYIPEQITPLEAEMVFYQKTPARIVFELTEKVKFNSDDVFFDLGSGLGQVAILVNLLTGVAAKGIELEPTFCDYANTCAADLNLPNVTFINADARQADYLQGTVFFMYTPFKGRILEDVLELLRKQSLQRKITIVTYGPCTAQVALQSWLHFEGGEINEYKLTIFNTLPQQ